MRRALRLAIVVGVAVAGVVAVLVVPGERPASVAPSKREEPHHGMDPADEEDRMNGSGCYETPANGNPPLIVAVGVAMSAALGFAIWSEIAEGRRDRKRAAERRLDSRGKAHSAS